MAKLLPWLRARFEDDNDEPLVGGKVFTYLAGTSTPLSTFTDESGGTPNPNPVILNSRGEAEIWLGAGSYKIVVTDANGVPIYTADDVSSVSATEGDSGWSTHEIEDGQEATILPGETLDISKYSSAKYQAEIIRGTTVFSGGPLEIQNVNGVGRVVTGMFLAEEPHGVTFDVTQDGNIVSLRAAADEGAGGVTIKLSRRLVPA